VEVRKVAEREAEKRRGKKEKKKGGKKTTDFASPPPILITRVRKAYQTKADDVARSATGGREKEKGGKLRDRRRQVGVSLCPLVRGYKELRVIN
jgi:hypothetical protein